MTYKKEARAALAKLKALGYSKISAKAVALELLALLERLPPGQELRLGRLDHDTYFALLSRLEPADRENLELGKSGTLSDDFATAAGAEIGKHSPHFSLTPSGLAFSPGKKL